jgi:hypothetical protein
MGETDHRRDEDALRARLARSGVVLGAAQARRLAWLQRRFGHVTLSDGRDRVAPGVAVVVEPPNGPGAERFFRALTPQTAVVIPFGENPGFDFLKSKLTDFGTVGPDGAEAPHEMWWGAASWAALSGAPAVPPPLIVACHPHGREETAEPLRRSAARLGLPHLIEPIDAVLGDHLLAYEKVEFLVRIRRAHRGPLLFVDPGAELLAPPLLPAQLDCDVALHKWNRWEMSARLLYVAPTETAGALLRHWQHLASSFPAIWEGHALDQAWSLTLSQMPLDTVWLPRAYHAPADDAAPRRQTVVRHGFAATTADLGPDSAFAATLRGDRRASRTGAREALIMLRAPQPSGRGVTVIMTGLQRSGARQVAAAVEAVTRGFRNDPGEFGQLELALCPWPEQVAATAQAAFSADHAVIEITAADPPPSDLFRRGGHGRVIALAPHLARAV